MTERGVAIIQAARDLGGHEPMIRAWVKDFNEDPQQASPSKGVRKPDQTEIDRLKNDVAKFGMEWDILNSAAAYPTKDPL